MASNISKIYLLNVPMEDDLKNTLWFGTKQAQQDYFNSVIGKTYTNCSYQMENRTFRCPAPIDTVRQYNYIMWQNTAFSSKWFYAFIKRCEFVSVSENGLKGVTDIVFEIDPIQTYMFDFSFRPSFVEREHTNNDTVGNHTLPENVELGDFVKNSNTSTTQIGPSTMWYAVGVSDIIGNLSLQPTSNINGLPNGLFYIFTDRVGVLHSIAECYDYAGKANAIYTMFAFPKQVLSYDGFNFAYATATWEYQDPNHYVDIGQVYVPTSNDVVGELSSGTLITKPTTVGMTYTPRNKKLLTYPYCFFNVSNNAGTTVTYRYEDFNGNPAYKLIGVFNNGCSTKLYPTNYKNMTLSDEKCLEYGIVGGKYPTVSWNSDSYTNWLTQNAVNIGLGVGSGVLSTLGSMATGNFGGAIGSFLGTVSNTVSQMYEASLVPDQAKGNTNVGDLNFSFNKCKFTVIPLSIKPEYASVIDSYFDLFGYKCCKVKYPLFAHRQNWWYTKTINANIIGNVPNDEMNRIKEAYNNGITYWRTPANFLNYNLSNGIV